MLKQIMMPWNNNATPLPISEDKLQKLCVKWFRAQYPKWLLKLWAVPNGGKRNGREAKAMQATGTLSGVCDLILSMPRGQWHGMFIELKVKDNDLSENQEAFIKAHEADYYCVVCYTIEEFIIAVRKYLAM